MEKRISDQLSKALSEKMTFNAKVRAEVVKETCERSLDIPDADAIYGTANSGMMLNIEKIKEVLGESLTGELEDSSYKYAVLCLDISAHKGVVQKEKVYIYPALYTSKEEVEGVADELTKKKLKLGKKTLEIKKLTHACFN